MNLKSILFAGMLISLSQFAVAGGGGTGSNVSGSLGGSCVKPDLQITCQMKNSKNMYQTRSSIVSVDDKQMSLSGIATIYKNSSSGVKILPFDINSFEGATVINLPKSKNDLSFSAVIENSDQIYNEFNDGQYKTKILKAIIDVKDFGGDKALEGKIKMSVQRMDINVVFNGEMDIHCYATYKDTNIRSDMYFGALKN